MGILPSLTLFGFRFFIVFVFGVAVIVLFMILVARVFEFFHTAFWAIAWVIA